MTGRLLPAALALMAGASTLAAQGKADCLRCHGPYEKLRDATARDAAPAGEKANPHRFVPHDARNEAAIPECASCHRAHRTNPVPARATLQVARASEEWCYRTCHHEREFTRCGQCHLRTPARGPARPGA